MAKKIYKEKQHFVTTDLRWVIAILSLLVIFILMRLYLSPAVDLHSSDLITGLLGVALLAGGLWFLIRLELKVAVSSRGIEYKMMPFHQKKRVIPWDNIRSIKISRTPRHHSWQRGYNSYMLQKKFTFSGRNGISIETTDGQVIFLGSGRVSKLQKALQKANEKFNLETTG